MRDGSFGKRRPLCAVSVNLQIWEHTDDASKTGSQVDGTSIALWIEISTVGTLTVALEDQWAGVSTLLS